MWTVSQNDVIHVRFLQKSVLVWTAPKCAVYRLNSKGARTVPCGAPVLQIIVSDMLS